jgi:hypothetical protein
VTVTIVSTPPLSHRRTTKMFAGCMLRCYLRSLGYTINLTDDALVDHVVELLKGDPRG